MQNVQIRYQASSAQHNYLSLYDLGEDYDSSDHELHHLQFHLEEPAFIMSNQENQVEEIHLDFTTFVRKTLAVDSGKVQRKLSQVYENLWMILMGEVLEYDHYLYSQRRLKKDKLSLFYFKHRKSILGHILVMILVIWVVPLWIIICLIILICSSKDETFESQLYKWQQISKMLTHSSSKLKFLCLAHHTYEQKTKEITKRLANELLEQVQRYSGIKVKRSNNEIDDLDEVIFQIVKQRKQQNLQQKFTYHQFLQQKLIYWRLKCSNFKVKKIIELIQGTIHILRHQYELQSRKTILKDGCQQKINISSIFNTFVTLRVKQLSEIENPSQKQKNVFNNIISILDKSISLHKVTRKKQQCHESSKISPSQEDQIERPDLHSQLFISQTKKEEDPIIFEDGKKQIFIPQSFSQVASKIEQMMQHIQKKKQIPNETDHSEIQSKPSSSVKVQLQRHSFGIPILPPVQNIQAFYLE